MAKQIKELLAEEIHPDHIRRGIAAWMTKDVSPSALPGFVNQVMNTQPTNVVPFGTRQQQSTADQRAAAGLALAAKYAQTEQQALTEGEP